MKLLIITQKIDLDDDILGFMHNWVFELAKICEKITIICLYKGIYELPENVKILSLGKENNFSAEGGSASGGLLFSKIKYLFRFYKYIWQERNNYEKVFVHMNKEYVVLGGLPWKMRGKKIALWYNHLRGNIFSKISGALADVIFYTSPFSFFAKNEKAIIMPAGIDTNIFKPDIGVKRDRGSLLFLGRISPVKNVDILIKAANILDERGVDFSLDIVGAPGEKDKKYFEKIKVLASHLENKNKIRFFKNAPNYKTPEIYNSHEIFVNLTNSGSMDKSTLEAMACESLVFVSNKSFERIFPNEWHDLMLFREKDEKDLADKIVKMINLSEEKKDDIRRKSRDLVVNNHSLKKLLEKVISNFNFLK